MAATEPRLVTLPKLLRSPGLGLFDSFVWSGVVALVETSDTVAIAESRVLLWWVSVDPAIDVPKLHLRAGLMELALIGGDSGLLSPSLFTVVLSELRIGVRRGGGSEL